MKHIGVKRIQYLHHKFDTLVPDEIFKKIIPLDPSRNKKYVQWALNLYRKGLLQAEDFYKVTEYLQKFERVKIKLSKRDINQYNSLPCLIEKIEQVGGNGKTANDETYLIRDHFYINSGEVIVLHDDEIQMIITPITYRANCFYAKLSQWCTNQKNVFNRYTQRSNLYIIINKRLLNTKSPQRLLQFHFASKQFCDITDKRIGFEGIKKYLKYFDLEKLPLRERLCLVYDSVGQFDNGFAEVCKFDKMGLVDNDGNEVIAPIYEIFRKPKEGRIAVKKTNLKWGFVDLKGNARCSFIYDSVRDYNNGFAAVKIDTKWSIINKNGDSISSYTFISVRNFQKGKAIVSEREIRYSRFTEYGALRVEFKKIYYQINMNGERCSPDYFFVNGKKIIFEETHS